MCGQSSPNSFTMDIMETNNSSPIDARETNKILIFSSAIVAIFVVGLVLSLAKSVLFPFFLAIFFYFVLSPILDLLTNRLKIPKALAVVVVLLFTFLALYLMGVLFYSSGERFGSELSRYWQKFSGMIESFQSEFKFPKSKLDPLVWLQSLDISKVGSFFLSSLDTVVSFLSTLFLVLIFLIFMLAGRGKLNVKIMNSFEKKRASQLNTIVENIDRQVQKYLALKTVICIVSGLIAMVIMLAFGLNFAVLFGFITLLLNYIPNIGSLIAKVFPFLFALVQFDNFWLAFWMLVVLFVFDGVLGMAIEPRLMGKGLGLSPLGILFALFFWGWLWGIPGMILAVPMMVILKIVCANVPGLKFMSALLSK
jgi:AI-2 transport protein TqsA